LLEELKNTPYLNTNFLSILHEHAIYSITDLNGIITNISNTFCTETGYKKEDMIGKSHSFLRSPDFSNKIYKELWSTITSDNIWHGQIKNLKKNGNVYWMDTIIQPIFNNNHKKIAYLSIRKNMTNNKNTISLINNSTTSFKHYKFNIKLNNFIINYFRSKNNFSIMLLDINNFNKFNNEYGHKCGGEVIDRISHVMRSNVRDEDFFSRCASNKFILILNNMDKKIAVIASAKLLDIVRIDIPLFLLKKHGIYTKLICSIGATSPKKSDSIDLLLSRLNLALSLAKNKGNKKVEIL